MYLFFDGITSLGWLNGYLAKILEQSWERSCHCTHAATVTYQVFFQERSWKKSSVRLIILKSIKLKA